MASRQIRTQENTESFQVKKDGQREDRKTEDATDEPIPGPARTESNDKTLIREEDSNLVSIDQEGNGSVVKDSSKPGPPLDTFPNAPVVQEETHSSVYLNPSQPFIQHEDSISPARAPPSSSNPVALGSDVNHSHAPLLSNSTYHDGYNQCLPPPSLTDPPRQVPDTYYGHPPPQSYPAIDYGYNQFQMPQYPQTAMIPPVFNAAPVYLPQQSYQDMNQSGMAYGWPVMYNPVPFHPHQPGYYDADQGRGSCGWPNVYAAPRNDLISGTSGTCPVTAHPMSDHEWFSPYGPSPSNRPILYVIRLRTGLKWPRFKRQVKAYMPLNLDIFSSEATTWTQQQFEQYKAVGGDKYPFSDFIDFALTYTDGHHVPTLRFARERPQWPLSASMPLPSVQYAPQAAQEPSPPSRPRTDPGPELLEENVPQVPGSLPPLTLKTKSLPESVEEGILAATESLRSSRSRREWQADWRKGLDRLEQEISECLAAQLPPKPKALPKRTVILRQEHHDGRIVGVESAPMTPEISPAKSTAWKHSKSFCRS